ncbi:MAG: response regulator [Desulfatibacillum sp.]|nr:response regulator [Desulfatibacillum sp.]
MNLESHCEQKPSILVVDDKPQNLFALKKLLDNPDYDIMTAISGNDALALALEHDFSVILMDVQMPGMNGFETARLLSMDEATKRMPVIFVTAHHSDAKHMTQGYAAGAVDYLSKPLNPEVLKGKISVFLALNRQKAALEKANKELEQANRANGDFWNKVGEEIRTPLFTIFSLAKSLMDEGLTGGPGEKAFALQEQAGKLLSTTNNLFEYPSIGTKSERLQSRDFDLDTVLRDVNYVLGLRARERHLSYNCTKSQDVPTLLIGDSTRLRQVILTMITNAVKFSHQGEVAVHVGLEENLDEQISLKFSMTETGEDEKSVSWQNKALENFKAFAPVKSGAQIECLEGPTLDLTIARQLVEAMEGKTGVEKEPGGGVHFWFTAVFKKQRTTCLKPDILPPSQKPFATIRRAKDVQAGNAPHRLFKEKKYSVEACSWPAPFRA